MGSSMGSSSWAARASSTAEDWTSSGARVASGAGSAAASASAAGASASEAAADSAPEAAGALAAVLPQPAIRQASIPSTSSIAKTRVFIWFLLSFLEEQTKCVYYLS